MDARSAVLCFSCLVLVATSGIYGWKFLKKRNYLLGIEWWVVTVSASNAFIFFLTGSEHAYAISHFLDAFSRGFGVPVIAVAGLMFITHEYKPSARQDVLLFGMAVVGTIVLVYADFVGEILPYFYIAMWSLLSIYLVYFVKRLLGVGEALHAITMTVALLASLGIACIYDFYKIPGDEHNVLFNFYVLALLTWSYMIAALYFAYSALERASQRWTPSIDQAMAGMR